MRVPSLGLPLLAACLLVAGCGAGGGGGGDERENPGASEVVAVIFPPAAAHTEADSIVVRGASQGGLALEQVTVAGVPAASTDDFRTWSVRVPLQTGVNALPVVATTLEGEVDPRPPTLRITRAIGLGRVESLDFDRPGNRLLLLDASLARLTLLDLATGAHRLLSGRLAGSGPEFDRPEAAIFDRPRNRALVADSDLDAIFAVDLTTGARSFLTGQGAGSGAVSLNTPEDLALDTLRGRVLVVDSSLDAVVGVNLITGERTLLSANGVPNEPQFDRPGAIELDVLRNLAYVSDTGPDALIEVDLGLGGARRLVAVDPVFQNGGGLGLDVAEGRMLGTDLAFDRVFSIDLATGLRTTLDGDGPDLEAPGAMAYDGAARRILTSQAIVPQILAVDPDSGDRQAVFEFRVGGGPHFDRPEDVAFDLERGRVLVADDTRDEIVAVGYGTGDRRTFVQGDQPTGSFGRPQSLARDPAGEGLYVHASQPSQIVRFDLDDGAMDVVSRQSIVGGGESLPFSSDLTLDAVGRRLFVNTGNPVHGVLEVDESSGLRSIFANAANGTGEATFGITALGLAPDRLFYGTNSAGTINVIDTDTGVRTRVTFDGTGAPPGPSAGGMRVIEVDAARGRLLVLSGISRSLIAVRLADGARTELAGPNVGGGVEIRSILDGDIDVARQLAVFVDVSTDAIVVLDVTNGERVTLTR